MSTSCVTDPVLLLILEVGTIISSFYRWGNCTLKRLRNRPKVHCFQAMLVDSNMGIDSKHMPLTRPFLFVQCPSLKEKTQVAREPDISLGQIVTVTTEEIHLCSMKK